MNSIKKISKQSYLIFIFLVVFLLLVSTAQAINQTNTPATLVIGQLNLNSGEANQGGNISANTLYWPLHAYVYSNKLFIADCHNNRVLIYNSIPTSNNASADVVIGQPDMTVGEINQGGSPAANTLYCPYHVYVNNNKLLIADRFNNRVLIYNSIPTSNNASADVVIGQPDFTSNAVNQGGNTAANTFYLPNDIAIAGSKLIVSDLFNNRVLIYNSIPTSNNASADVVIGQPDFTSKAANQGGNTAANTLTFPVHVTSNNSYLFVPDDSENSLVNNRVLLYPLGPQNISVTAPSDTQHRDIVVNLTADDAKQIKISEDSNFSGVGWQDYSNTINFNLSEGKGQKIVYVKFRDYANYEKTLSFNITYTPVVSVGLPAGFTSPPSQPANSDFKVIINNGAKTTTSSQVNLKFIAGSDTARVAISEDPKFKHAPLVDYKPEMDFTLSAGEGKKTIYVKYYTKYGYATQPISSSIILQPESQAQGETKDNLKLNNKITKNNLKDAPGVVKGISTVNLDNYKLKLIKYPNSPTVYLIDSKNRKNPFFNEEAFIGGGYHWEDIVTLDPSIVFPDGIMIKSNRQIISEETKKQVRKEKIKLNLAYNFTEYLFLGYRSPQVRDLQRLLKKLDYFSYYKATGYFGPITERAVKLFQEAYNLPQTGTVGPMTRKVLNSL